MARSVFQYEQPRCPDNWNEAERRFYNRLIETLDDIYSKYGRLDEKMLSKGVLNRIDNSTATSLEKMAADILSAGKIAADSIEATFAYLVSLSAKYGSFDFETVKNLVADAMVLEKGQADYVHITNLAATYAQAVNATIGNLVIQSSDGKYYQLDVSADGKVSASEVKPSDKEISAGETSDGKVIVGTHITAETLGTATLAATQALINMIDASRINVDTLVAREEFVQTLTASEAFVDSLVANTAFIKLLGTTTIVGDKSLTLIAGEASDAKSAANSAQTAANAAQTAANSAQSAANNAQASADNLDRMSNIEVIEGTFAQTTRREGEGIRIYSEIGPKQDKTWGDPYPAGGGRNLCPFDEFTTNTSGGNTTADAKAPALTAGQSVMLYGETTDGIVLNGSNAQFIFKDDSGGTVWAISPRVKGTAVTVPDNYGQATKMHFYTNSSLAGKTVRLMIEVGSATEWSPNTNICPIEGWTGLNASACGKNLCDLTYRNQVPSISSGMDVVFDGWATDYIYIGDNVVTLSHYNARQNDIFYLFLYDESKTFIGVVEKPVQDTDRIISTDIAGYINARYCRCRVHSGTAVESTTTRLQLEYGTTPTPYAPYQGNTYFLDFGKNLLPNDATATRCIKTDNGYTSNVSNNYFCELSFTPTFELSAGTAITYSIKTGIENRYISITFVYSDNTVGDFGSPLGGRQVTATVPNNGKTVSQILLRFNRANTAFTDTTTIATEHQLELGSTATSYTPYNAELLDKTGGMVYGGKVDWHAGEMTVNDKKIDLGTYSWTYDSAFKRFASNHDPTLKSPDILRTEPFVCTCYKVIDDGRGIGDVPDCAIYSVPLAIGTVFYVHDNRYTDANDFTQAIAGQAVVYPLAEPYTIQLTPVQIETLRGINTVYTDADGGRVEFGHDLVEVIDNVMPPASPKTGTLWLDRSLTPAVLRRWSGSEWEIVNDVSLIESVQDAILLKQAELEEEQRKTALYLKLDDTMKAVRIGQTGITSEFRIDAFGSGVVVNDEIFSRFEANRVLFGNMEIRRPNVGGLAFDSIK